MPIYLPEKCLRNRMDCHPLSQIEADDQTSFICCGLNNGADRKVDQDKFTYCWLNEEIDQRDHVDEKDIIDTISVLSQALSAHQNMEVNHNEHPKNNS